MVTILNRAGELFEFYICKLTAHFESCRRDDLHASFAINLKWLIVEWDEHTNEPKCIQMKPILGFAKIFLKFRIWSSQKALDL